MKDTTIEQYAYGWWMKVAFILYTQNHGILGIHEENLGRYSKSNTILTRFLNII